MDFFEAFDKINHSLLLHKLAHHGITGGVGAWIKSFLRDWQQAIVVDGC